MPRRHKDPRADARKPCKFRRKERRNGILADWCHAIGFEEVGDMPCNNCETDRDRQRKRTNGAQNEQGKK